MRVECFGCDAAIEGADAATISDRFVAHAGDRHDWSYPEEALRTWARNYAEATERLTGGTERLAEIGEVIVRPVTDDLIDDWLQFFDHDAFADNPGWAECYCLEPHDPDTDEQERPWREKRAAMVERIRDHGTFGYLAYVEGRPAGWVNASMRSDYAGSYRTVSPEGSNPSSVIGVSCFVIAPPFREHGVASALLDRVIEDGASRGAAWIEAYPHNQRNEPGAAHFFRGPRSMYDSRGFEPIETRERDTVVRRPVS